MTPRHAGALQGQASAAQAHLDDCHLCPFHCGPVRAAAQGVCRVGRQSYLASEMLHMGEEQLLRPAHALFFSGCTAGCTFCTAARFAFRPTYGVAAHAGALAERVLLRQAQGARALAFIGGDPVPHLPLILELLALLGDRLQIPSVLNSNFYLSDEGLALVEPVFDIFLPDLKFGPATSTADITRDCGRELGAMPDYWPTVTGVIDHLYRAGRRLVVRHLLMPGHIDCCTRPVLGWLAQRPGIEVSLLTQYVAPAHARGSLAAELPAADVLAAQELARALRLALVD